MEKGRNNAILLTVIGIATLLVAIVGATFAYFSAQTTYTADSSSILTIQSAAGGTSSFVGGDVITVENIYPVDNRVWASKTVNITYTNATTNSDYKYDLAMVYENEFASGEVAYRFAPASSSVCSVDGLLDSTACQAKGGQMIQTHSTTGDVLVASSSAITGTYNNTYSGNPATSTAATVTLGTGTFKKPASTGHETANTANHVYVLEITYPNKSNTNQNANQGKTLAVHITYGENHS